MRTKRHLAIFTTITELHSGAPYQHKAGPLSFRRLLGVDISSDLSLDHHVSRICAGCYYRLRQHLTYPAVVGLRIVGDTRLHRSEFTD